MVKEYWGVFCKDILCRHIRGFSLQIDTGSHSPICCKSPRYGTHKYEVMQNLVERLDENGVVEEEDGTWGELVVLSTKPHQENFT